MATAELVTEQFNFFGIELSQDTLNKCTRLCEEHNVDPETFVELWMAFSLNNLNGSAPSVENLDQFARKEFQKQSAIKSDAALKVSKNSDDTKNFLHTSDGFPLNDEVIEDYGCGAVKKIKTEPGDVFVKTEVQQCSSPGPPSGGAKYNSRTNSGVVLCSFGNEELLKLIHKQNDKSDSFVSIHQVPNEDGEVLKQTLLGFELLRDKAFIYDSHIHYLSRYIMHKAGISETVSVRLKTQHEVYVAGQVECDADARLNPKSVVLQGTWEESLSQYVPVDIDQLEKYSLFPGQVVVFRGSNPTGNKFMANEVYYDASVPLPDKIITTNTKDHISMIVVAGPYTTSDNLTYDPLRDLVTYINNHQPDVVIMTGPFVDCENTQIQQNLASETFRTIFERSIEILNEINSKRSEIYIIASSKDAFHVNIYPTPPYLMKRKYPNIHFMPDPCTLNIDGLIIGITSADILMHLSQEEIARGVAGDKLSRLAGHLLCQQGFWPTGGGPRAPVDAALWAAHAHLPTAPHLLLLPSNFRCFVKEVNGSVILNPEHLTKGLGGGTFGHVMMSKTDNNFHISAQVIRI